MLKNYDPDATGTHVVRITLMVWGYVGHIAFRVGGNCKGADLLTADIFEDELPKLCENDCDMQDCGDEDEACFCYTLHDEGGEPLEFEYEEAEEVKSRIVGIEIVDFIPEEV